MSGFVSWLLNVGRYIVIFTELVVIGAFLSRFWLDRENADLSERLRQEKAILDSTLEFENEFNLFQSRLLAINESLMNVKNPLEYMDIIIESMPKEVILSRYSFGNEGEPEASIAVSVFSESDLAKFVDNLISKDKVTSVKIGTIKREEGDSTMKINFTISFGNK